MLRESHEKCKYKYKEMYVMSKLDKLQSPFFSARGY